MNAEPLNDDRQLLQLLAAGDEIAFGILFNRYKGLLYVHAYRKLQDREEVRDIIQEIFVRLWEKRSTLGDIESLSAYLYSAVRYKVIDRINRKQRTSAYIEDFQSFLRTYAEGTDYLVREKMLTGIIEREIEKLPPKMKLVFEMSRKQHLSHKEIAEQLNLSEQSVRSHVKNALHILKLKLGMYLIIAFWFHQ